MAFPARFPVAVHLVWVSRTSHVPSAGQVGKRLSLPIALPRATGTSGCTACTAGSRPSETTGFRSRIGWKDSSCPLLRWPGCRALDGFRLGSIRAPERRGHRLAGRIADLEQWRGRRYPRTDPAAAGQATDCDEYEEAAACLHCPDGDPGGRRLPRTQTLVLNESGDSEEDTAITCPQRWQRWNACWR